MIKKNDFLFLLYFLPLFIAKLLMFDTSSNVLKIVAFVSFSFFCVQLSREKFKKKEFQMWILLGSFLSLLVFTCGKEGALFSFITLLSMRYTNIVKNKKIMFWVGLICVVICIYTVRDARIVMRYNNGSWVETSKRSNIAFICYFAVTNLYLLAYKKHNIKNIMFIGLVSACMYKYTGCRSGFICAFVLIIMLLLYKVKWFYRSKFVRLIICSLPSICYISSILIVYLYKKGNIFAVIINNYLQGRLRLGRIFLDIYKPKLFGQVIFESNSASNFLMLDSAYLDMYLCYGVIFSALWLVITTYTIIWLYRKEEYIGISVIISYVVFGMTETFLPNCFLNPSILLYGECILDHYGGVVYESDLNKIIKKMGLCC